MSAPTVANRVETLERRMTPLALLPGQIANLTSIVANLAVQISQLREELRVAVSAPGISRESQGVQGLNQAAER
jgi:hypothetical protein